MAIGVPEVRQALQKGPRSRDDLARDLHCGRADISKQLYSLIRAGEAIEEGDIVMLTSQPRKTVESEVAKYVSTLDIEAMVQRILKERSGDAG